MKVKAEGKQNEQWFSQDYKRNLDKRTVKRVLVHK